MVKVIVAEPAAPPVTTPVPEPTVAEPEALQVPGVDASVSVIVAKEHTADTPPMAAGNAFTVIA